MSDKLVPDITFDKVSKGFNGRDVLRDVSFEIAAGEVLCVMGRSGMGKSVTLKLIIGLLTPDAGTSVLRAGTLPVWTRMGCRRRAARWGSFFKAARSTAPSRSATI